jgi:hypothetical protein
VLFYNSSTRFLHIQTISLRRSSLNFLQTTTVEHPDKPVDENYFNADELDDLLFNIEVDLCSELEYIPNWDAMLEESYQDEELVNPEDINEEFVEEDLFSLGEELSDYTLYLNESVDGNNLDTVYKTSNTK